MAHIPGTAVFWVERRTISKMKNFTYITIWNLHCIYMFVGFVWNETMYMVHLLFDHLQDERKIKEILIQVASFQKLK